MSTIRKTFTLDDVLTDMTSVKLSSSDAVYGVKRTDTDAVVVADNTIMSKIATGTYQHTFSDPATGLTYRYSLEVTYGGETYWITDTFDGPVAVTSSAGMTGAEMLAEVRLRVAQPSTNLITDAEINKWLQNGMRKLYVRTWLGEHTWDIVTTATSRTCDWPAAALGFKGLYFDGVPLEHVSRERYVVLCGSDIDEADTGDPRYWLREAGSIIIYPAPTANGTTNLKAVGWRSAPTIVSGTDYATTDPLCIGEWHEAAVLWAIYMCRLKLRNYTDAGIARQDFKDLISDVQFYTEPPESERVESAYGDELMSSKADDYND